MFKKLKTAFFPEVSQQEIIEEIHESFDTASDKLLHEAKNILSGKFDIEKGVRLKSLGFVQSKKAVEADSILASKKDKEKLASLIEYYQMYYPNNKFITEEMVKSICEKYHLLCGEVKSYIGDVPLKNIEEIENFKLREEEMEVVSNVDDYNKYYSTRRIFEGISNMQQIGRSFSQPRYETGSYNPPKEIVKRLTKEEFKICAPKSDFDLRNMEVKGYKIKEHIPDPIVLQPVKGGYLIVSKWGLEASDSIVVNEVNN